MTGNEINRGKLDFTIFWKVRSASSFMHLRAFTVYRLVEEVLRHGGIVADKEKY